MRNTSISHFKAISRHFVYWVIHFIILREKSDCRANLGDLVVKES